MKKLVSLLVAITMIFVLFTGCESETSTQDNKKEKVETTVPKTEAPTEPEWKLAIPAGVDLDLEYAFDEIGEDVAEIESIEYVGEKKTAFFVRRDYKLSLSKNHKHSRRYRITTEEWNEGEPEREKYPREYLVTIKFWTDDNTTNINQWTATGNGELQDSSAGIYYPPAVSEVILSTEVGESSINPIVISADDLVREINTNIDDAKEKYNGKWVEITGTITYVSDSAGMTGYYLYGERGGSGLNITCWVYDENAVNLSVGDSATFVGALREISTFNNTEIGDCIVK